MPIILLKNTLFPCFVTEVINPTQYNELGPVKRRVYDDIMYFLDATGDIQDTDDCVRLSVCMTHWRLSQCIERQILANTGA